jgi:hypothetical protein
LVSPVAPPPIQGPLAPLGIGVHVDSVDRTPKLVVVVAVGLGIAAAFAVFGLPDLPLPMPTWAVGVVTPTCGLTRASTALARGQWGLAWAFNPAAYVLAAAAAGVLVRWAVGRRTGRWVNVRIRLTSLGWVAAAVVTATWWAQQQLNAEFVMNGTLR